MSFRRIAAAAIGAFAAVLLLSGGAAGAVNGFTHQAQIDAGGGAGREVIAIEFYPGVKLPSQPVITDQAGKAVPSKVLMRLEYGKLVMLFDGSGGGTKFTLHYGGRGSAERPGKQWEPAPSLLMEVRSKPPGTANSWAAMKNLLAASAGDVQGMMFVPNIFHGHNPFGPSDEFITIYTGEFVINKEGDYRLFTASSDASFVKIDGKRSFSWPGVHGPWGGRLGQYGKDMHLTAGKHAIEYIHVQIRGQATMCLGWRMKKDKNPNIVPAGWFTHTHVAKVSSPKKKASPATAHFTWSQNELMLFDKYEYVRYTFHNRSTGKADSILWDFHDGVTSSKRDPRHIFTGPPPYKVSLTVKSAGKTDTFRINVPMLTPMNNTTINDRRMVKEFAATILTYPFEKLPGPALGAFFELLDTLEQPVMLVPMCEAIKKRTVSPSLMYRAIRILATAYSITDPKKAIPLLERLKGSGDPSAAIEAKIDLLEIYLHKFRDFEKAKSIAEVYASLASKKSIMGRLARVKVGDIYLMQGEIAKAEEKYRQAQDLAFAGMRPREVAVRQGAYGEAVLSLILRHHYRAARTKLLEWEADFPTSKITGGYILMSSRYWEAVGDARKALDNMQALLKINPLTPYLPQIEYRMGNAYRDLGEKEKARALYQKVIREYPLNPITADAQTALAALR